MDKMEGRRRRRFKTGSIILTLCCQLVLLLLLPVNLPDNRLVSWFFSAHCLYTDFELLNWNGLGGKAFTAATVETNRKGEAPRKNWRQNQMRMSFNLLPSAGGRQQSILIRSASSLELSTVQSQSLSCKVIWTLKYSFHRKFIEIFLKGQMKNEKHCMNCETLLINFWGRYIKALPIRQSVR